ncbi:Serine/threonine-protein kinase StkP [Aquisphaera giovannonii]|uniref:Serine/threonine-protein kinase StkP n=1 Tax=Aquisphaera giovannonii TaxID=406548 RepID=A0A5B9W0R3_9BACT|nr:serine/threonine-protein kinase [Aquisphaera giovannonii]QEH34133.1 Serine/threonine-protein kinase StkP [Aquisphaera giovannonii]
MSSLLHPPGDGGDLGSIVSDVRRLEEQWQVRGDVPLEEFWRDCRRGPMSRYGDPLAHLGALIKADMRCRFERGRPAEVAQYLDRFPGLDAADSRVISLIYEEYCLREESGETPDVEGFCRRYPRWSESFVSQLRYHRLFSEAGVLENKEPNYPRPGDLFEEFRLDALIGKGGSSRVYLAQDLSLGGKRVVLKVSLDNGQEPKTQGVLDHPHIVPVNSVAYQTAEGLRGLSMPYRPGLPLDDILRKLRPGDRPARAAAVWEALLDGLHPALPTLDEGERASLRRDGPSGEGWRGFPRSGTFAEAAAWLAMVLARALHYAHEMHTFHRDVKPGNILLTVHHGPQLLDFNLAASPYVADRSEYAMLGGTLPYMAPEQIRAFLDPQSWDLVGAQSDIYSLGLVLREMLTGQAPALPNEKVPLPRAMQELLDARHTLDIDVRSLNPRVPYALQAIVSRCLQFEPGDRYPDAQALADDLDAFLHRRPLRVAVNPSRLERLRNWAIRNRGKIAINAAYLTILGGLGVAAAGAALKPDPATLPEFKQAVRDIQEGRADAAAGPLRSLVREYPRSPLPRAYLGLAQALSTRIAENDAQLSLREFFGLPGAEELLLDWMRRDPTLAARLVDFVQEQLEQLNRFKVRRYAGKSPQERAALADEDRPVERRYYEVMLRVARLALKVDPNSESLPIQMAIAEEALGEYEPAYGRLDRLIEALKPRVDRSRRDQMLHLISQRARVAMRWSGVLLQRGDGDSVAQSIKLLQDNLDGMESCQGEIFEAISTDEAPGTRVVIVYNFYWIMTECWLALTDAQRSAGLAVEAAKSSQRTKASFDRLAAFVDARALNVKPDVEALGDRVRKARADARRPR